MFNIQSLKQEVSEKLPQGFSVCEESLWSRPVYLCVVDTMSSLLPNPWTETWAHDMLDRVSVCEEHTSIIAMVRDETKGWRYIGKEKPIPLRWACNLL
jgi:hypothetical protein